MVCCMGDIGATVTTLIRLGLFQADWSTLFVTQVVTIYIASLGCLWRRNKFLFCFSDIKLSEISHFFTDQGCGPYSLQESL